VADSDRIAADQNFFDDQPENLLTFDHIESIGSSTEFVTKVG
jgi:hypothetical protein